MRPLCNCDQNSKASGDRLEQEESYRSLIEKAYVGYYGKESLAKRHGEINKFEQKALTEHKVLQALDPDYRGTREDKVNIIGKIHYEKERLGEFLQGIRKDSRDQRYDWMKSYRNAERLSYIEARLYRENGCKEGNYSKNAMKVMEVNNKILKEQLKSEIKKGRDPLEARILLTLQRDFQEKYGCSHSKKHLPYLERIARDANMSFKDRHQNILESMKEFDINKGDLKKYAHNTSLYFSTKESTYRVEEFLKTGKVPTMEKTDKHMEREEKRFGKLDEFYEKAYEKTQAKMQSSNQQKTLPQTKQTIQRDNQKDIGGFEI